MQIAITDIMAQNKESVPGRSRSHSPVHNVDGPGEAELEAGVDRDLIEFIRRNIKVFDRHMHMTCTSTELLCHSMGSKLQCMHAHTMYCGHNLQDLKTHAINVYTTEDRIQCIV